jgi:hypothetical protein
MLSREGDIIGYSDCTLTIITSAPSIAKAFTGLTHPGAESKRDELKRRRRNIVSTSIKRFVHRAKPNSV